MWSVSTTAWTRSVSRPSMRVVTLLTRSQNGTYTVVRFHNTPSANINDLLAQNPDLILITPEVLLDGLVDHLSVRAMIFDYAQIAIRDGGYTLRAIDKLQPDFFLAVSATFLYESWRDIYPFLHSIPYSMFSTIGHFEHAFMLDSFGASSLTTTGSSEQDLGKLCQALVVRRDPSEKIGLTKVRAHNVEYFLEHEEHVVLIG